MVVAIGDSGCPLHHQLYCRNIIMMLGIVVDATLGGIGRSGAGLVVGWLVIAAASR